MSEKKALTDEEWKQTQLRLSDKQVNVLQLKTGLIDGYKYDVGQIATVFKTSVKEVQGMIDAILLIIGVDIYDRLMAHGIENFHPDMN